MAYSGSAQVLEFTKPDAVTVVLSAIDVSASSADYGHILVPVPMIIYQFGMYITETLAATVSGSIFLSREEKIAGTEVTIAELDLDATNLAKGDATRAAQTASTGSEDISAGEVVYSPQSLFPVLVTAPQLLALRLVQTAVVGEMRPFIVCRWLAADYRGTEVWSDST